MVEYRPQSLGLLRERIPKALERVYDINERVDIRDETHVFDLESGLRLYVAKKVMEAGSPPFLHVTADIIPRTLVDTHRRQIMFGYVKANLGDWFVRLVIGQFKELHPAPLTFLGFMDKWVPHFYGEIRGLDRAKPRLLEKQKRAV